MSEPTKVVVIRELKTGPTQFQTEVERLKAVGKFPSVAELLAAVAETRAEYREKILATQKGKRGK